MRFPGFEGEWKQITLGECSISLDYGMNAAAKSFDGINKYIRITDIDENSSRYKSENPVSPSGNIDEKYLVGENDILFARTGASTGKSYLYNYDDGKLYFAGFLIRAKIKNEHNSKFIFSQTQTEKYNKWVQLMSMRSGQPGINSQEYSSFKFYLSSIKQEQDKIANFLTLIDERIATQNKIIKELKLLKNTLSKKLFSLRLKFRDGEGNYFQKWQIKKLKDVSEIIGGGTPETNRAEYWNGHIQWFTPTEIKSNFVSKSERTISELGLKNSSARLLPKGTILLTTRATIGEVSIALEECTTNQGFQSLIVKENYNNIFLFNWLKVNKYKLERRANGSTFAEISKSEIEKIEINVPSIDEQTKIAKFLLSIDTKIDIEVKLLQKIEVQKKYLLADLFI